MKRDIAVYCSCTFLLGLVIGSFVIGPRLATRQATPSPTEAAASPAAAPPAAGAASPENPMMAVRQQIATLKDQIARNPRDTEALVQLGSMYMEAAKFPEARQYFERALAIREDANVRIDLGICYKQEGQLDQSLQAFKQAAADAPGQWQPAFNEAIVLGEMRRFDEAKAIVARLKVMRPNDPDVQRLDQALAEAR